MRARRPRSRSPRQTALLGLACAALAASPLLLREPAPASATGPDGRAQVSPFVITASARHVLQQLWHESVEANEERVACLGGYQDRGVYVIARATVLPVERADSLRVSPRPSLDRCGPPEWSGTAHTHIVPYRGAPFRTFSANDRVVLAEWRSRWRTEGIFCVLFTSDRAYCEYGTRMNGEVAYATPPPQAAAP